MGEVYKVEHVRMGRIAAMKMIHGVLAANKEARARFSREAKAVSRLTHHNTVQVFDFGSHKEILYLVMEYVRGEDLGTILKRDGPMRPGRLANIAIQICRSLSEAHEYNVIHRDIKPENLLLTRDRDLTDIIKVVDFGLATIRAEDQPDITAQGSIIGTPYYMAPEQIRGEDASPLTDIYSLGGVMYKLVTGEVPFTAPSPMVVLTRCLTEELVPPIERRPDLSIPPMMEKIVCKAMAKDPHRRYSSADEMAIALQQYIESASGPHFIVPLASSADQNNQNKGRRATDQPVPDSSMQLRREDFDSFEKSLVRRRIIKSVLPLLLLVAAGGVLYYLLWHNKGTKQPVTLTREKEPNNTTDKANPVGNGVAIKGTIGKRLSETESDVDVFRFELPEGAFLVDLLLWPQRNMDLSLRLFRQSGEETALVAQSQITGESGPEALLSVPSRQGVYYAVVSEVVGPKGPTEGLSDCYRLIARWRPLSPEEEQEPNDSMEQAQPLPPSGRIKGSGLCSDKDYYRIDLTKAAAGSKAFLKAELDDPKDVLRVTCAVLSKSPETTDPVLTASAIKVVRAGEGRGCNVEIPAGAKGVMMLVERRPETHQRCRSPASPEELAAGYTLVYRFSNQPEDALSPPRKSALETSSHQSARPPARKKALSR